MTAAAIAKCSKEDQDLTPMTLKNIQKVTRFRRDGEKELEKMVDRLKNIGLGRKRRKLGQGE